MIFETDIFDEPCSPSKKDATLDKHGFVIPPDDIDNEKYIVREESPREAGKRLSKEKKWNDIVLNWNDYLINFPERVLRLTAKGIPMNLRSIVWRKMLNIKYYQNLYDKDYFDKLCLKGVNEHTEQIELDIPRTFPNHKRYFTQRGKNDLLNVLQSYSHHNAKVGYCQGMSYIAGVLVMYFSPEDAFWMLVALLERETMGYYIAGMPQLISDANLFGRILSIENNQLFQHLKLNGMDPLLYVTPWWMCFFTTLPDWDMVLRIWDLILWEGVSSLFRISLSVLKHSEPFLLAKKGAEGLLPFLLRPPMQEIGGIEKIIKLAIDFPMKDLIKQSNQLITQEKELLTKKRDLNTANEQSNTNNNHNNNNNSGNGEISIFEKIINTFGLSDDSNNTQYGGSPSKKLKPTIVDNSTTTTSTTTTTTSASITQPTPSKKPTSCQQETPVKTTTIGNRMMDFSRRLKNRFINKGYQPCQVIHEQRQPTRKSIRPSVGGHHVGVPRKSISAKSNPQTPSSGQHTIIVPRKSIARPSVGGRPLNARVSITPGRKSIATKKMIINLPNQRNMAIAKSVVTKGTTTSKEGAVKSSPYKSSTPIKIPTPSKSSPVHHDIPNHIPVYSPQSIKINPPPPSSTPLLKILSPSCTNSQISNNNLLNMFNNNSNSSSYCSSSNSNSISSSISSSNSSGITNNNLNNSCNNSLNNSQIKYKSQQVQIPISPFKRLSTFDTDFEMEDLDVPSNYNDYSSKGSINGNYHINQIKNTLKSPIKYSSPSKLVTTISPMKISNTPVRYNTTQMTSFNSPLATNYSPSNQEKRSLKEFSTPTPRKESIYKLKNNSNIININNNNNNNTPSKFKPSNNNTNNNNNNTNNNSKSTPIGKNNKNNINSNNNNNMVMDDLEMSPQTFELQDLSHSSYLEKKQAGKLWFNMPMV